MANSRNLEELKLLKGKLLKLTAKEDVETATEEFVDILRIFEAHNITADIIQAKGGLGLGPAVHSFVKKLKEGTPAHEQGTRLLKTWKDIVTRSSSSIAPSQQDNKKPAASIETSTFKVETSSTGLPLSVPISIGALSSGKNSASSRKAARSVLQTAFVKSSSTSSADKIVSSIEAALDSAYSGKEYASKYRSLAANLKKNEMLNQNVRSGAISVDELIRMTPAQLASTEIRELREKLLLEEASARAMNWADENKEKIQGLLGIDPNNTWEFDDDEDGLSEPDIETGDA